VRIIDPLHLEAASDAWGGSKVALSGSSATVSDFQFTDKYGVCTNTRQANQAYSLFRLLSKWTSTGDSGVQLTLTDAPGIAVEIINLNDFGTQIEAPAGATIYPFGSGSINSNEKGSRATVRCIDATTFVI